MLHVEFVTDLGAKVTVDVAGPEQLLDVQRHYGRLGWTSGEVPAGGYLFPLDNKADFDWSLIGARPWTNPEGEVMILHRGHAYRRRELEAVDSRKLKLPKAVKYSRGAKPTDPEHLREKADGEIEYVTLAIFRGGKRQERFAVPAAHAARPASREPAAGEQTRQAAREQTTREQAPRESSGREAAGHGPKPQVTREKARPAGRAAAADGGEGLF